MTDEKNCSSNEYLDAKHSTVSDTSDIDAITKYFDDHISLCKIKEACGNILRE